MSTERILRDSLASDCSGSLRLTELHEAAGSRQRPGPFFIGGTGRCGTSQLNRVLGEHPLVHSVLRETRFLIDPGGFEDLTRALTVSYTPAHADDALRRLAWLLQERLTGQTMEVFRGYSLPDDFPPGAYSGAVEALWKRLVWYEYEELVPPLATRFGHRTYAPGEQTKHRRVVARRFETRADLIAVLRSFTDGLFSQAAAATGKATWCEKTPFNLLSTSFLWELFPEATIIVITRDPRRVVRSYLDQIWAPSTPEAVISFLQPVYERWLAEREELVRDPRYVEVKLEELAADWPARRPELFTRLGLPDSPTERGFDLRAATYRDEQLTKEQIRLIEDVLGRAILTLGYG